MSYDLEQIARQFQVDGQIGTIAPFGSGHINDTYCVVSEQTGVAVRYVLQRINHTIFKDPVALMDNVRRVTDHIRGKLKAQKSDIADRQLVVIEAKDGTACYADADGNYWRMYNLIEDAVTFDQLETPELAYEAARMFGWFQRILADLPQPPLVETIPDFHTTPKRYQAFLKVLEQDPCGRAKEAQPEIDFVLENAEICDVLLDAVGKGEIPVRITHNDTKINNVMLDAETRKGVCVIDLDTVMPGLSLYDFGDMVRTATSPTEEDETDLSKISMRMPMFEMLAKGFAAETHTFLTEVEKKNLAFSGKLITFEQMIRFLGDHLAGDTYYKIHRQGHNLDRTRTQMKLVQSIIEQEDEMNAIAEKAFSTVGS